MTRFEELWVNDSDLFSKQVNEHQGDGFLSVGIGTGAINFAMATTYLGLMTPILILYTYVRTYTW